MSWVVLAWLLYSSTPQAVVMVYKSCWSTHSKVNLTVKFYCHEYIWFPTQQEMNI